MKATKWVSYLYEVEIPDEELKGKGESEQNEMLVDKLYSTIRKGGWPDGVVHEDRHSEIEIEDSNGHIKTIP